MLRVMSFILLFAITWVISVAPTTAEFKRFVIPIGESAKTALIKSTPIYGMVDENCISMSEGEKIQLTKKILLGD